MASLWLCIVRMFQNRLVRTCGVKQASSGPKRQPHQVLVMSWKGDTWMAFFTDSPAGSKGKMVRWAHGVLVTSAMHRRSSPSVP